MAETATDMKLQKKLMKQWCIFGERETKTITNNAISIKVLWLWKKRHNLNNSRNRTSVNDSNKGDNFSEFPTCIFDIFPCDWRQRIRATRTKDKAVS